MTSEASKRISEEVNSSFGEIFKETTTTVTKKTKKTRRTLEDGWIGGEGGEYAMYLAGLHRQFSMGCVNVYNAFYRAFQAFFSTGRALVQRTGAHHEALNKVYTKYGRSPSSSMGHQGLQSMLSPPQPSPTQLTPSMTSTTTTTTSALQLPSSQPAGRRDKLSKSTSSIFSSLANTAKKISVNDLGLRGSRGASIGPEGGEEASRVEACRDLAEQLVEREQAYIGGLRQLSAVRKRLITSRKEREGSNNSSNNSNSSSDTNNGSSTTEDIERVFGNIGEVLEVENWVCNALEQCPESTDPLAALAKALITHKDSIERVYTEYVRGITDARYTYYRTLHGTAELEAATRGYQAPLGTLLRTPTRHVSRLLLYAQSLLEAPCTRGLGAVSLAEALGALGRVAGAVDHAARAAERHGEMLRVRDALRNYDDKNLDDTGRGLVYDGVTTLRSIAPSAESALYEESANKSIDAKLSMGSEYHAVLLTDTLLLCRAVTASSEPPTPALLLSSSAVGGGGGGGGGSALQHSSSSSSLLSFGAGLSQQGMLSDTANSCGYNGGGTFRGHGEPRVTYEVCAQIPVACITVTVEDINEEDNDDKGKKKRRDKKSKDSGADTGAQLLMPVAPNNNNNNDGGNGRHFAVSYRTRSYTFGAANAGARRAWVGALRATAEKRAATQVFGVPVAQLMSREGESGRDIPRFLGDALGVFLGDDAACKKEGVFRISGGRLQVAQLQRRVDAGETPRFEDADPHVVASLVKLWFHSLPRAILPFEDFHEAFEAKDAAAFKALLLSEEHLSQTERFILHALFTALTRVLTFSSDNKMDTYSVCVVVAPFLIRPRAAEVAILCSGSSTSMVEFIFNNFDFFFDEIAKERKEFVKKAVVMEQEKADAQKQSLLDALSLSLRCPSPTPQQKQPAKSQTQLPQLPPQILGEIGTVPSSTSPAIDLSGLEGTDVGKSRRKHKKSSKKDSEKDTEKKDMEKASHKSPRKKHRDQESASPNTTVVVTVASEDVPEDDAPKTPQGKKKSHARRMSLDGEN